MNQHKPPTESEGKRVSRISQWATGLLSSAWRKLGPLSIREEFPVYCRLIPLVNTRYCSITRCPLSRMAWLLSSDSCTDKRPSSNLGMISSTTSFVQLGSWCPFVRAAIKPSRSLVISQPSDWTWTSIASSSLSQETGTALEVTPKLTSPCYIWGGRSLSSENLWYHTSYIKDIHFCDDSGDTAIEFM